MGSGRLLQGHTLVRGKITLAPARMKMIQAKSNLISRNLPLFCLLALLSSACDDDNVTTIKQNPFIGKWNITFSGSYQGSGTLTVKENGTYHEEILLSSVLFTITGTVTDQGIVVDAIILQNNSQVGTMLGKFSSNSGNGTWQTDANHSGNWAAQMIPP